MKQTTSQLQALGLSADQIMNIDTTVNSLLSSVTGNASRATALANAAMETSKKRKDSIVQQNDGDGSDDENKENASGTQEMLPDAIKPIMKSLGGLTEEIEKFASGGLETVGKMVTAIFGL